MYTRCILAAYSLHTRCILAAYSLRTRCILAAYSRQALAKHCGGSLHELDISWCRGVSDDGAGLLVDSCAALHTLTLWGCSQLSQRFFLGHSNEKLRIVGRGPTQ